MDQNIYDVPKAAIENTETSTLTASERLAQSRKDIEESSAVEKLNMIWGVRLVIDVLFCGLSLYILYRSFTESDYRTLWVGVVVLVYFGAEIIPIVGYFKRRKWCVIPLHIFSGFSLLNFPFGTILSIMHYFNMNKMQFRRDVE